MLRIIIIDITLSITIITLNSLQILQINPIQDLFLVISHFTKKITLYF